MKVVTLLSGGIDSSTLLYYLLNKGFEVHALTFDYGQTHKKEITHSKKIILEAVRHFEKGELTHLTVNISGLQGLLKSALTGHGKIPDKAYDVESQKATVVPNRNMIFIAIATGYAQSIGAERVYYAAHWNDSAIYADCRKEFVFSLNSSIELATGRKVTLWAPFVSDSKAELVKLGLALNVPFEKTWSCYKGEGKACGKCGTCRERINAFKTLKLVDPIEYEIEIKWR